MRDSEKPGEKNVNLMKDPATASDVWRNDSVDVKSTCRKVDDELWKSFVAGSRTSLNAIFQRYARLLYVYGRNMTSDDGMISDCIQDLFVELWVKRESVSTHVNAVKYYLLTSLRRRIARRLSIEKRLVDGPIPENYSDEVEFNVEVNMIRDQTSRELSQQLQASVASLSGMQREAIYLKFYENLTHEQIAAMMNINIKAVYNLISRSIFSLRKYFNGHSVVDRRI